MYFADGSRGKPYSKDPAVVWFKGRYVMYYSVPPFDDARRARGWAIGIAESNNLTEWRRVGELSAAQACEERGFCAPGAMVLKDRVHLFYQSYGNGPKDAICHATSSDGVNFVRNPANPVFRPTGSWNNGRAIDADVMARDGTLFLYFATRDPLGKVQKLGVATAPLSSDFGPAAWTQHGDRSLLEPSLAWEQDCIEAPAVCLRDGKFFLFYAGAYNNAPQQIGCAMSADGLTYRRLFTEPFLPNGKPGSWNHSESGHPFLFTAPDNRTYLFFQGNNDKGKTWHLSQREVLWQNGIPSLAEL